MSRYEQDAVSRAVWPWAQDKAPPAKVMPRPVRALLQTLIMLVISFLLHRFGHHISSHNQVMSKIVLGLAGVVLVSGLVIPPIFLAIERFGHWLGHVVSVGLTWGLLVPFYYLCFVPARIGLRLKGKDPMTRECPTDATTYWIPRKPVKPEQYRKQH